MRWYLLNVIIRLLSGGRPRGQLLGRGGRFIVRRVWLIKADSGEGESVARVINLGLWGGIA